MDGKEKKIRVAILCRGYNFDAWEAECIREVKKLSFVEIVLLISEPASKEKPKSFFNKIANYPYRNFLWRWYKRFKLKIASYEKVSLEMELKDIPQFFCEPELKGKYSQHFSDFDIQKIKSYQTDVILRFAYNILRGEILTVAQYGVWSFHHADEQIIRGGPAAFWEIYNGNPVTSAILQRLTEKLDAGIILRKGYFPTIQHSFKNNLEQLLSGTTSWMKQELINVWNEKSTATTGKPIQTEAKIYSFPTNAQMISFRWKLRKNKLKFHYRELFKPEQWNIGIVKQSVEDILEKGISNVDWFSEPKSNEYYADPFGWESNGELKIVFEHYNYKKQKGVIAISNSGKEIETLKEKKEHLSYPFVIDNNSHLIIPECNASQTIFSFTAENVEQESILLNTIPAIDASPVFFNNRWWLFCTREGDFNNTELFLYHAAAIEGPWTAHENNPVKCDVRSSRPGGTPFVKDGKLFRPAQDCSWSYGSSIVINEVTELTENTFAEKVVKRIEPKTDWKFNKGLHTFSIVGKNKVLIDAKRYTFNFDNFNHVMGRKIKRLFGK
jgi:hypothetical protein